MKAPQTPSFALAVPGTSVTAPRDGRPLNQTKDALFIAVLHERSRATGWLVGEMGQDGVRHYQTCPPPADPQSRKGGPIYLATKTLRRRLVQNSGLFDFRRLFEQPSPNGAAITVMDEPMTEGGEWKPTAAAEMYFSCIVKPIHLGQPDMMIAEVPTTPLFSWCDLTTESPAVAVNCGDWVCPHCGVISARKGIWRSPLKTWAIKCGRAYEYKFCVACVLVFDCRLAARN